MVLTGLIFGVVFLWLLLGSLLLTEYSEAFANTPTVGRKFFAFWVLLLGAPVMAFANFLSYLLDTIFPEGWNDDCLKKM